MKTWKFLPVIIAVLVLFGLICPTEANAEPLAGWRWDQHASVQFSAVNPQARRILFTFHRAEHPATGRQGVLMTTHRITDDGRHVGLQIKVVPADHLVEYSPDAASAYTRIYTRGFFDDLVDLITDVINEGREIYEWVRDKSELVIEIIDDLQSLHNIWKALVQTVMKIAGEVTVLFAEKVVDTDPDAVVELSQLISDIALRRDLPLASKVGQSFDRLIQESPRGSQRRELVWALQTTIRDLP